MDGEIDFEKRFTFLENFKTLTLIVDRLMKRWALVHVGYENNPQLAKEDAQAKTRAAEEERLKNAPIEDKIQIVASFDPIAKEFIDAIPGVDDYPPASDFADETTDEEPSDADENTK